MYNDIFNVFDSNLNTPNTRIDLNEFSNTNSFLNDAVLRVEDRAAIRVAQSGDIYGNIARNFARYTYSINRLNLVIGNDFTPPDSGESTFDIYLQGFKFYSGSVEKGWK